MSPNDDLPEARGPASADQARRGLVSSAGRSLAARTRDLLARHGLRPRKSLGQSFLINEAKLEQIAGAAAEMAAGGPILEVGPGLGALTVALAGHGQPVVAVEVDQRLQAPLAAVLEPLDNVTVHFADFLTVDLDAVVGGQPFVLAGNLPYQITTPLLEKAFAAPRCVGLVITVQREVAQRLRAQPGTRDYSPLTLFCQYHVERVETICQLAPGDFLPAPAVASTALVLHRRTSPPFTDPTGEAFLRVVRAAFNQRRKALRSGLAGSPLLPLDRAIVAAALETAALDGQRRAETLTLEEFARLARALGEAGQADA